MAITDRQRNVVSDVKASVAYFKTHENPDKVTLSLILGRAGIENQGNFYSVVTSFKKKWDTDPEAKQLLRELKESLGSVGIVPTYLEDVRTYTRKAQDDDTLELERESLPSPKRSKKVLAPVPVESSVTVIPEPSKPVLGGLSDIAQRFEPANEVHALNLTIFALQGLPQLKRENIMQAAAGFFGLGSAY